MKKKYMIFSILIILLINVLGAVVNRGELFIVNTNCFDVSHYTKLHIQKAYFDFNSDKVIAIDDLNKNYRLCKNVEIVENHVDVPFSSTRPYFEIREKRDYLFISVIDNLTLAGEESRTNRVFYVWIFIKWIKVKEVRTGIA